jgi:hypothetical protein
VFVKENVTAPISSLSLHIQLNETHGLFKLFSADPLTPSFLDTLFKSWAVIEHRTWLAYPHFHPPEV